MRLKSFTAKTMSEAMQMVREALGEEAIIVATREEKGSEQVRVTAAVDQSADRASSFEDTLSDNQWLQYDTESDGEDNIAEALTEVLLKHSVPADVLDHLISVAITLGIDNPRVALQAAMEHLFSYKELPETAYDKALMMVGVPGAGKTLAVAKMAAQAVVNDLNAVVITTDLSRAGGIPQLEAFTKLMGIELSKARDAEELKDQLGVHAKADIVLIDTAGSNPFDPYEMKDLAKLMGAGDVEPFLVMPAGGDPDESGEIARAFSILGVHSMMPTKTDVSRRMGGLLTAAQKGGMSFADTSNTSAVADGLIKTTPEFLTNLMVPMPNTAKTESESIDKNQSFETKKQGRA